MDQRELKDRFKKFALRIMKLANSLSSVNRGRLIGDQLFRSGTSSAANYRAALRGRSVNEFISKLCIAEEELDECMFWMELMIEGGFMREEMIKPLLNEANELLSIVISTKKTTRKNKLQIENRQS
ncbi:MAG: four helix bundle protein [Patescibacteria group bacterium]|jgi:four helix bundle protein